MQYESTRQLSRQRPGGKLLRPAQALANQTKDLPDEGGCKGRLIRLHRDVLQPKAPTRFKWRRVACRVRTGLRATRVLSVYETLGDSASRWTVPIPAGNYAGIAWTGVNDDHTLRVAGPSDSGACDPARLGAARPPGARHPLQRYRRSQASSLGQGPRPALSSDDGRHWRDPRSGSAWLGQISRRATCSSRASLMLNSKRPGPGLSMRPMPVAQGYSLNSCTPAPFRREIDSKIKPVLHPPSSPKESSCRYIAAKVNMPRRWS